MSTIHFIGGEKGGVGKSLFARVLAQYLIDHQLPLAAYDSDKSHGALLRYYGDYTEPLDVERTESLDQPIERAAADPQLTVLVDLAAQSHQALQNWLRQADVPDLAAELGIGLTYWHVLDASHDSATLLGRLSEQLDPRIRLHLVLNEIRGDQFTLLQDSGALAAAQARGAQSVALARLPDATVRRIDSRGSSFWAAINASGDSAPTLGLLERQRVKVWLRRAYDGLARVGVATTPADSEG
ncbi:MAG: mobilization protein [Comamonas sp.]